MYTNATAITRYIMDVVDTLDLMGYDAELTSLDRDDKECPWEVVLDVVPQERTILGIAGRFVLDVDPSDDKGTTAVIPTKDFTYAGYSAENITQRDERSITARMALHDAVVQAGKDKDEADFYNYGLGFLHLAQVVATTMEAAGLETGVANPVSC